MFNSFAIILTELAKSSKDPSWQRFGESTSTITKATLDISSSGFRVISYRSPSL